MGRDVKANPRGVVPPSLFAQSTVNADSTITANRIYFVDTSTAPVTLTLPTNPFAGDIIKVFDKNGTFQTNSCTMDPGSHRIMRVADTMTVSTEGASFTLVYSDTAGGWLVEGI